MRRAFLLLIPEHAPLIRVWVFRLIIADGCWMGYPQPQHPQHPQHAQHPQHPQHPQHAQHAQHSQHSAHSQHPHHQIRHFKKRPIVDPRTGRGVEPVAVRPRDLKEWLIVELRHRGETEKAEQVGRIPPGVPDIVERLKGIAGKEAWLAVKLANQNRNDRPPNGGTDVSMRLANDRPRMAVMPSTMGRRLTLGASAAPRAPMFTGSRADYDHYMASRRFMSQPVRHDDEGDGTQHRVRRRVRDRLISPDGALYRLQDAGPDCPMNLHSAICQWIEAALSSCLRTVGRGEPGRPSRITAVHMARWLGTGSAIMPLPLKWPPSILALIRSDSSRVAMGVRLAGEKRPRAIGVTHTRKVVKVARTDAPRGDEAQRSMQQRISPRVGAPVSGHSFGAAGAKRKLVTKIRAPAPSMPQGNGNYRADAMGPRRMFVKKPMSHAAHVSHVSHAPHVSQATKVDHNSHASYASHASQHSQAANAAHYPGPERTERALVVPAPAVRPPAVDTSF